MEVFAALKGLTFETAEDAVLNNVGVVKRLAQSKILDTRGSEHRRLPRPVYRACPTIRFGEGRSLRVHR